MTLPVDTSEAAVEQMAFFVEFGGFHPLVTPQDMLRALRTALTAREQQIETACLRLKDSGCAVCGDVIDEVITILAKGETK